MQRYRKDNGSDLARGKIQLLFLPEGHPSSDEDVDMVVPDDDEELEPMSSEPHEKSHQPEEPIFYPREEFNKYNYAVNLSKMADMAEGGELHVGQLDLHTNPNATRNEGVQQHNCSIRLVEQTSL